MNPQYEIKHKFRKMNHYSKINDLQLDLLFNHRAKINGLSELIRVEKFLTDRLGKVHAITVDFRKQFLIPAMDKERKAQELARPVYDIVSA